MIAAISFALALLLSTALIPVLMHYAPALGLLDKPDSRKVHLNPIPRIGGVGIAIAFFIPVLLWVNNVENIIHLLLALSIIVFFGFVDDKYQLNYKWKFFGQILAVAIFLSSGIEITKVPFWDGVFTDSIFIYFIVGLFLLGVTNAVNLSDGLDGLAAGSTLLSLGFIAVLAYMCNEYTYTIIALSAMGALTGFLRFNTHPATIFMGDTGSQFLGFATGALALLITQSESSPVSSVLALGIVGVPVLDTLMVMLLRIKDGHSPFKPDKRHLHHQFLKLGFAHYQTVAALYILNFTLLGLMFWLRYESDWVVVAAYILFCLITVSFLRYKMKGLEDNPLQSIDQKSGVERRNPAFRNLTVMHKFGVRYVEVILGLCWISYLLTGRSQLNGYALYDLIALVFFAVVSLAFLFSKIRSQKLSRFILYGFSLLTIYFHTFIADYYLPGWKSFTVIDLMLLLLVLVLAVAIRTTRRELFRLDNQDILVLLILLAAPFLSSLSEDNRQLIGAVLRLAIMIYASEYIVVRAKKPKISVCFGLIACCCFGMTFLI